MPDGSVAGSGYDTAPNASPVQVAVRVSSFATFTFSATGFACNYPVGGGTPHGPEGDTTYVLSCWSAPENGIANVTAPLISLVGVFLDDNIPDRYPAPPDLDFSTALSRDFFSLSPTLRQPFFIGDGLTSGGVVQQFVAPDGATRLFLGTLDGNSWSDNSWAFTVTATMVPEPSCFALAGLSAAALVIARRRN